MTTNLFRNRLSPEAQFHMHRSKASNRTSGGTRAICRKAWLPARQTFTGTNSVGNGRRTVRYSLPEFLSLNSKNMQVELPETTSKIGGPLVRQFSVFLPNKVGAMLEVVKLLNAHATHVVALSVSESTDAAIARIIVSDPERVEELFRAINFAFGVC